MRPVISTGTTRQTTARRHTLADVLAAIGILLPGCQIGKDPGTQSKDVVAEVACNVVDLVDGVFQPGGEGLIGQLGGHGLEVQTEREQGLKGAFVKISFQSLDLGVRVPTVSALRLLPDRRDDNAAAARRPHRAQGDIGCELRPITAVETDVESRAHWPRRPRGLLVSQTLTLVTFSLSPRNQCLDVEVDQVTEGVSRHSFQGSIRKHDVPPLIHRKDAVGHPLKHLPQLWVEDAHKRRFSWGGQVAISRTFVGLCTCWVIMGSALPLPGSQKVAQTA